ncbi:MAG: hypothetical protein ACR2MB_06245 [Acidimicrobiales bacterium]
MALPAPETALAVATDLMGLVPASRSAGAPSARFSVVSFRGRPRFLLPRGWPAATQAACLSYLGLRDRTARFTRRTMALGLRTGALERGGAARTGTIDHYEGDATADGLVAHLARFLGQPEVAVAVGLGVVDAVWKPTLHVFAPDGTPLAFVKVGRGPVAAALVARETAALRQGASHPDPRLVVANLMGSTTWRGLAMVAVAPLPTDARRLPGPVSAWPVRTLDDPVPDGPLGRAAWWANHQRAAGTDGDAGLEKLLQSIEDRHGGEDHAWARWHGDWVPWNQARCHLGLVAWDWEYSEPGAPVGLDEVHGRYQLLRVGQRRPVAEALAAARAIAPSPWVADAHLAMLLTRDADLARLGGRPSVDAGEIRIAADGLLR